jgi:hypothetical protein
MSGMLKNRVLASIAAAAAVVGLAGLAPATAATPSISFAPAVVVDAMRLGGEPIMALDSKGNIYISSIIGFSNHTSMLWKSEDGGESFDLLRLDLPGIQRPSKTVGGGDSAITIGPPAPGKTDDTIMFIDLEGLATFGTAVSFDGGNSFTNDNVFASGDQPLGDRQWGGVWRDPQGTDHYYNFYNGLVAPGAGDDQGTAYAIIETTDYGKTWHDWKRHVTPTAGRSRPGPVFIDKANGDMMLTWTISQTVGGDPIRGGGTPTGGAGFTICTQAKVCTDKVIARQPNLNTNNTFATGAMDRQGNLYVAWSGIPRGALDPNKVPTRVYMSVSRNKGKTWSKPVVVSEDVPVASMPTIAAGDAGRVSLVYYGSAVLKDPNENAGPWFPYMTQSLNALDATPSWTTVKISDHSNHVNPICTNGTACTALQPNDRNLIDFFWVSVGPRGESLVTWVDTAHQIGSNPPASAPITMFAKQTAGPSLYADVGELQAPSVGTLEYSRRANRVGDMLPINWRADAKADAHVPRHSASGPGEVNGSLDVTATWIEPAGSSAMRVVMQMADLSTITVPSGSDRNFYMVWWWADTKVQYVAAEVTSSGAANCFAGEPAPANGSTGTRWGLYAKTSVPPTNVQTVACTLDPVTGRISFDVPHDAVDAHAGQILYSVHGSAQHFLLAGVAASAFANLPDEIDQTSPFNYRVGSPRAQVLGSRVTRTPPRPAPGGPMPATGVGDFAALGIALVAGSMTLRRWLATR